MKKIIRLFWNIFIWHMGWYSSQKSKCLSTYGWFSKQDLHLQVFDWETNLPKKSKKFVCNFALTIIFMKKVVFYFRCSQILEEWATQLLRRLVVGLSLLLLSPLSMLSQLDFVIKVRTFEFIIHYYDHSLTLQVTVSDIFLWKQFIYFYNCFRFRCKWKRIIVQKWSGLCDKNIEKRGDLRTVQRTDPLLLSNRSL